MRLPQGAFYVVACILFAVAVIVAWLTPALNRAVAFGFAGLAVVAFVWAWVQLASTQMDWVVIVVLLAFVVTGLWLTRN